MNLITYNKLIVDMAFDAASKPLIETEYTWGQCEHCGKRTNVEADFQFVDGEWKQISSYLCNQCKEK